MLLCHCLIPGNEGDPAEYILVVFVLLHSSVLLALCALYPLHSRYTGQLLRFEDFRRLILDSFNISPGNSKAIGRDWFANGSVFTGCFTWHSEKVQGNKSPHLDELSWVGRKRCERVSSFMGEWKIDTFEILLGFHSLFVTFGSAQHCLLQLRGSLKLLPFGSVYLCCMSRTLSLSRCNQETWLPYFSSLEV